MRRGYRDLEVGRFMFLATRRLYILFELLDCNNVFMATKVRMSQEHGSIIDQRKRDIIYPMPSRFQRTGTAVISVYRRQQKDRDLDSQYGV